MRLHCPKCADAIPAQDINIRSLVAKCERCDNVFSFQHDAVTSTKSPDVAILKRPKYVTREESSDMLAFAWSWKTNWALPVLLGSILLLPGIIMIGPGWFMLFVYTIICLYGFYWAIAHMLNQTIVLIDHESISVKHAPVPWPREQYSFVNHHMQLYVGKHLSGGRYPQEYFAVNIAQQNGKHRRAIEMLKSAEHALYLEQEIEAFLGIADQPVRGELSRGL